MMRLFLIRVMCFFGFHQYCEWYEPDNSKYELIDRWEVRFCCRCRHVQERGL